MYDLPDLIAYLDERTPAEPIRWGAWQVRPVLGGQNNRIYRATSASADCAIKLTIRDERDRAGHEHAALTAIASAGGRFAPCPVWLDRERYRQPVVVQAWVDAPVLAGPPASPTDWRCLLDLFCSIHQISPASTPIVLSEATVNIASAAAGRALIDTHLAVIPSEYWPDGLGALLERLEAWELPAWPEPPRGLCRVDSNWRNFLRAPQGWRWTGRTRAGATPPSSGPSWPRTPPTPTRAPWAELLPAYAARMGDPTAPQRVQAYTTVMWVWWAVRWARYLYEVPRGLDPRLAERPAGWLDEARQKYARALATALGRLDG